MDTITAGTLVNSAVVIGFVNAVTFYLPQYVKDARTKVALALVAALFLVYIPVSGEITAVITLLFGSSGLYKGLQVVGAIKKK